MIKIQNLTAGYGKKIVLSDINLELENQTYGIIGPNGSGKTTLFRVLTSFRMLTSKNILTANLKICSGDILVSDSCNNKKMIGKKNCQIGYLSQKFGCMPQLTVKEQLQYFCYLKKIPASEEEYEISRVLDAVHMSEFANQKCKKLSGGMVRRVGIAQAILGKPQLYANSLFRFSYHCVRTLELSEANTRYGIRRTIKKCIFACTGHRDFSFDRVSDIGFNCIF